MTNMLACHAYRLHQQIRNQRARRRFSEDSQAPQYARPVLGLALLVMTNKCSHSPLTHTHPTPHQQPTLHAFRHQKSELQTTGTNQYWSHRKCSTFEHANLVKCKYPMQNCRIQYPETVLWPNDLPLYRAINESITVWPLTH